VTHASPNPRYRYWVVILIALVALSPLIYRQAKARLPYPPGLDQDSYLAAGQIFEEHLIVPGSRPLYAVWMGVMYLLSGRDLQSCFYFEKTVSVLLLSGLLALLCLNLFDAPTCALSAFWVLNCKYLFLESNGSHAFAASLIVAGALCFFLPVDAARRPLALLLIYLSTLVRPEMVVPCLAFGIYLGFRALPSLFVKAKRFKFPNAKPMRYWIASILFAVVLNALFIARAGRDEFRGYFSILFLSEETVTYIERNGMRGQFEDVWKSWEAVRETAFPNSRTTLDAIKQHPDVVMANILFNIKKSVTVLAVLLLAFGHPILMSLVLVVYIASYVFFARMPFRVWRPDRETTRVLIAWAVATCSIIPIVIALHVSARQYMQLIPLEIVIALLGLRIITGRLLRFQSKLALATPGMNQSNPINHGHR
jgi:hypothetical protein